MPGWRHRGREHGGRWRRQRPRQGATARRRCAPVRRFARQGEPAHPDRHRRRTRRRRGARAALAGHGDRRVRASRSPSGWSVRGSTARPRTWCSTSVPIGCSPTTRRRSSRSGPRCATRSRPRCANSASSTPTTCPARSLDAALDRFLASIASVREFGKLGAVVFPFPSYFTPGIAFARLPRMAAGPERRPADRGRVPSPRLGGGQAARRHDGVPHRAPARLRVRRRAVGVRQLAATRCRSPPPTPRSSASTAGTAARGSAAPTPATTASRTTTRTSTSNRGRRGSRSWRDRRSRCT